MTLTAPGPGGPLHVNFDNATKLLSFSDPNSTIGAVTYGLAAIGLRSAHSFIPEFEAGLPTDRLSVGEFATRLQEFFMQQWNTAMAGPYTGPSMTFVIGGFNEGEPYGRIFLFEIPAKPTPVEQNPNAGEFGITWGGQREFVDRLIRGYDQRLLDVLAKNLNLQPSDIPKATNGFAAFQMQIPLAAMPLQDCVDLAIFFIRTTIVAQRLSVGIRGCGGFIDVATVTRRGGLVFVQQKRVVGEEFAEFGAFPR